MSTHSVEEDEREAQRILAAEFTARGEVWNLTGSTTQPTGIRVTTRRRLLNYTFRSPRLEVDGAPPMIRRWGTAFIPVTAGGHVIRCYYPRFNLFNPRCGDSSVTVDVPEAQVVALQYTAPAFFCSSPGRWRVNPLADN
jgi:hypothetical protein